jgi:hypothetical protein
MKQTFKVKMLTDSSQNDGFIDLYIEAESITGFYIPEKKADYDAINIIHDGGISTLLTEPHIKDYLYERFVVNCVK